MPSRKPFLMPDHLPAASASELQRPASVVETVGEALRQRILSGDLPDGTLLNQVAIAREYAISRVTLREACRQLEAEGLLAFQPGKGAAVSSLSLSEISEVVELRAKLEPDLLQQAIPHLTKEDYDRASDILDHFEAALDSGAVETWGDFNWKFHSLLYAPSGRSLALGFVQNLHRLNHRYARMQISLTKWEQRAAREHRALLAFSRRKETSKAVQLLRDHIVTAGEALVEFLQSHRAEAAKSTKGD
jgi:DNA-binding GntR family transcriptional regulator